MSHSSLLTLKPGLLVTETLLLGGTGGCTKMTRLSSHLLEALDT